MIKFLQNRYVYHALIWLFLVCFFVFISIGDGTNSSFSGSLKDAMLSILPMSLIVYSNFFLKAYFLDKRKYLAYILGLILLTALGVIVFDFMKRFGYFKYNNVYQHVGNVFAIMAVSTGMQYLKRGIINQYQLQELRVKTVENELNSLKAQLNPHFLFNTLNNIYGVNHINPATGSEMIMELSQLMRYHLDSSKAERVSIFHEIDLLKSYIQLEKLRLHENCDVSFEVGEINTNQEIAPLILLPFVENAFKHGTHSTKASFVHISCKMNDDVFEFAIRNSVFPNKKVVKTNIGLENTKRRLALIYSNKSDLNIKSTEDEYIVKLKLKLNT